MKKKIKRASMISFRLHTSLKEKLVALAEQNQCSMAEILVSLVEKVTSKKTQYK
jgi:hypothetical protein